MEAVYRMQDFENHPIFICGHPKAGTSLITALLDGHPAIVAYPEETLFFRRFLPAIAGKSREEALEMADRLLIHVFEWNQESPPPHQKDYPDRDYGDISFPAVRKILREVLDSVGSSSPAHFLSAALIAFGRTTGLLRKSSRYWVEKSPYNERYSDQIFSWWPEARCLHIVRDPRDNFVSYQRKQPDWSAKVFAWNWVRSTRAGMKNRAVYGPNRYHLLRFEDLLKEPEKTMESVAVFLDLGWHPAFLQPTRVGDAWRGNSMFAEKYSAISTAPLDRWKKSLSAYDLAVLQTIARRVMRLMGYDLASVDAAGLTVSQRLKLLREKFTAWVKQP
jgi:hypothetical protein